MPTVTTIDPVTRLEGHLKIEVTVETQNGVQQVIDARATGTLFRGFENILLNRHPFDAQHITQRICGVCPVSHGLAAVMALDAACGVTAPTNARIMRNLVLGPIWWTRTSSTSTICRPRITSTAPTCRPGSPVGTWTGASTPPRPPPW